MPQQKQVILFNNSGLDSDVAKRFKVPGNSDLILNDIISFIEGEAGARINIKGNESVYVASGGTTFIGKVNDIENSGIIIFVHNISGNHSIIRFSLVDNSITQILTNQNLGFSVDHPIIHANVVGELLMWTNGLVSPNKININKAIAGDYAVINEETITAAKIPPKFPPRVAGTSGAFTLGYFTVVGQNVNNMRGDQFQFSYRWIYDDKEKSNFSSFSQVPTPVEDEILGALFNPDRDVNNSMRIAINTGSDLVESIEIAVRIGDLGAWQSYEILDKVDLGISDDSEYVYVFNNNRIPTVLDQNSVLTANNFNPQLADTQEFLPTNELCYGGVTEGFDNIEIDIELSPEVTLRPYTTKAGYLYHTDIYALAHYIIIDVPEDTPTLDAQSEYTVRVQFADGNVETVKFSRNLISSTLKNKIYDVIRNIFGFTVPFFHPQDGPGIYDFDPRDGRLWLFAPDGETNSLEIQPIFPALTPGEKLYYPSWINMAESSDDIINNHGSPLSPSLFPDVVQRVVDSITITHRDNSTDTLLDPLPSFGDGDYEVGLVYEDGFGRISSTQLSEDSNVKVSELSIGFGNPSAPASAVINVDLSVKNRPPEWAKYWRPVITRNTTQTVVATWIPDYFYAQRIRGRGQLIFSISSSLLDSKSSTGATYGSYQYQQGDYLRVVGKIQPDGQVYKDGRSFSLINDEFLLTQQKTIRDYDQTTQEFVSDKIDVVDSDENPVLNTVFQNIIVDYDDRYDTRIDGTLPFDINRNTVIQIVRPMKESSEDTFFGTGQVFEVGNPGQVDRFHKGLSQDQSASDPITTPAIVILDSGGRYGRTRFDDAKGVDFPVLETELSDIYSSKAYSIGKPFVEDDDSEQRKNNLLRHSGKYFDNTNINDLSNFKFDNYVTVDDRFGNISRIIQVGDALKVYQPLKTTAVYIGKSFIKQGDGTDQVMTVDRTFGVVNPSTLDYGCQLPNSVLRNERYVYFFDIYSGAFLRDAPNGLTPVSENLMDGYFKAKSKALLVSGIGNIEVLTGYDDENGLVYVSFIDSITPANNETLAYHEKSNRWITFLSFIPDMYASFGSSVLSTKGNQLYIHNSDNVHRCEFYGIKYPRKFKVYSNPNPSEVKTFFTMSLFSNNNGWSASEIIVEANSTYPRGMFSRLKSGKFIYEEGVAHADFMRNMLTRNNTLDPLQLAQGDQLRGEVVGILLEESNDEKTTLYEVDVKFSM